MPVGYGHECQESRFRPYTVDRLGNDIDSKIDQISNAQYDDISNHYLDTLSDEIDLISETHENVEFDLNQGVLTLSTGSGTYVINRQPPNKQIWLSSPLTGPNRYDLIGGKWKSLRDNGELTQLLSRELSDILGTSIQLQLDN
ncbi:Mitochondrial matrix iron chaperone [Yamadazyma tenuis]|uniref:Mitochondrial matrix iron chaperone n=1 Tax=Candida tenuis TaxID=2315449 RepID=UPI0027AB0DD7|nr:Mitochondrial matrix iron chaperone [Yamadazyma tenuis]